MHPHSTHEYAQEQGGPILAAALEYHRRGWSIIPIKPGTKRASRKWEAYQTDRPTEANLTRWFNGTTNVCLAVIFGDVSGGLVCRDFDTMEAYTRWNREHPDLAAKLPTVATSRGRHVYFLSSHRGVIKLDDGELRGAGYCLLPRAVTRTARPTSGWSACPRASCLVSTM